MNTTPMFWLRVGVVTALAFLGSLQTALYADGVAITEWVGIGIATLISFGGYLGLGFTTPMDPGASLGKSVDANQPPAA